MRLKVLGLNAASPLRYSVDSWVNVHLLFELLLCAVVIARYQWCVRNSLLTGDANVLLLSRHLSRTVYLILYGVIGLREIVALGSSLSQGTAPDFSLIDQHMHHGPDSPVFDPRDDCQLFLVTGIIALIMVRALAFRLRRRRVLDLAPVKTVSTDPPAS